MALELSFERGWPIFGGFTAAGEGPALSLSIAGHGTTPPNDAPAPVPRRLPGGAIERIYALDDGELVDSFVPFPALGREAWLRRVRYTNTGRLPRDLTRVEMRLRTPLPGASGPDRFRMFAAPEDRLLCVASWGETDFQNLTGSGERIQSTFHSAWRLQPGQTAVVGHQGIWLGKATHADGTRVQARRWYAAHGFRTSLSYPAWIRRAILYEASAAGHIDSRFSDTGGFDAFARQLPYLRDLGVNVLWLNAVQTHKTGPDPSRGWNHYDPLDFSRIDPVLGGEEGFSRLGQTLEANEIRLVSEIVPHGGHSVQAQALEAWWTRGRDGKPRRNWGGFGMDNASPEWRKVLHDSMAHLAANGPVEGARIDVADGQGPNWGSPRTRHASRSGLIAGREVLSAVAEGIRTGGCRRPLLLPEAPARPEYFRIPGAAVVGYGFETTHFLERLSGRDLTDPLRLNRLLREHFERQRGALPPGALVVRSLNNHDTVCARGRATYRFGAGLHRALYGVCLSVPGIPMLYQEEEVGSFAALRRLNHGRRSLPALADSPVRYPEPGWFAPGVFAAWRGKRAERILCLVNLGAAKARGEVVWPGKAGRVVSDRVSAISTRVVNGRFAWEIGGYETSFLVLGAGKPASRSEAAPPAVPASVRLEGDTLGMSSGPLRVDLVLPKAVGPEPSGGKLSTEAAPRGRVTLRKTTSGAIEVRCTFPRLGENEGPRLCFTGMTEWAVRGRTALLRDRYLRRHYPFPAEAGYTWRRNHCWGHMPWRYYRGTAPVGRVWEALIEPLHPRAPDVLIVGPDDQAFLVRGIDTDAMNVVLTDGSDEGPGPPERL